MLEPKNALVKQYQRLFGMENVALRFTEGALRAVARQAMKRNSGARGLRSILENVMLDLMYEIPSQPEIRECVIGEEVILRNEAPLLLYEGSLESRSKALLFERDSDEPRLTKRSLSPGRSPVRANQW